MHVNELMTLIKDSGPKLNGRSMRELERLLDELWSRGSTVTPLDLQLIRYRRRKRIVVGAYWLDNGSLRGISIRRNQVELMRYVPKTDKIYRRDNLSLNDDYVSVSQQQRWNALWSTSVTAWLNLILAPAAPAVKAWQQITANGTLRDRDIQFCYQWQGNDYRVIKQWMENGANRMLALGLEENRLVPVIFSITYATMVGADRISPEACTELLLSAW